MRGRVGVRSADPSADTVIRAARRPSAEREVVAETALAARVWTDVDGDAQTMVRHHPAAGTPPDESPALGQSSPHARRSWGVLSLALICLAIAIVVVALTVV